VPLTVRLDPDAARRLRVAAARRGITQGRLLDEILVAALPPADPMPTPASPARTVRPTLTAKGLRQELTRLGLTQAALAVHLRISAKAVSEWFERDRIPVQRMDAVIQFLRARRAGPKG
jgi:plasmid stability protein